MFKSALLNKKASESQQLILARACYEANKSEMDKLIIEKATEDLERWPDPSREEMWDEEAIWSDGIFDPWYAMVHTPTGAAHDEYDAENGNQDDETEYMSSVCEAVLEAADPVRFRKVIDLMADIRINGL